MDVSDEQQLKTIAQLEALSQYIESEAETRKTAYCVIANDTEWQTIVTNCTTLHWLERNKPSLPAVNKSILKLVAGFAARSDISCLVPQVLSEYLEHHLPSCYSLKLLQRFLEPHALVFFERLLQHIENVSKTSKTMETFGEELKRISLIFAHTLSVSADRNWTKLNEYDLFEQLAHSLQIANETDNRDANAHLVTCMSQYEYTITLNLCSLIDRNMPEKKSLFAKALCYALMDDAKLLPLIKLLIARDLKETKGTVGLLTNQSFWSTLIFQEYIAVCCKGQLIKYFSELLNEINANAMRLEIDESALHELTSTEVMFQNMLKKNQEYFLNVSNRLFDFTLTLISKIPLGIRLVLQFAQNSILQFGFSARPSVIGGIFFSIIIKPALEDMKTISSVLTTPVDNSLKSILFSLSLVLTYFGTGSIPMERRFNYLSSIINAKHKQYGAKMVAYLTNVKHNDDFDPPIQSQVTRDINTMKVLREMLNNNWANLKIIQRQKTKATEKISLLIETIVLRKMGIICDPQPRVFQMKQKVSHVKQGFYRIPPQKETFDVFL